jgi:predicted RNA polymerase sigma factor
MATENWGIRGLPENPVAWLYTVAKNKAKNYFKHHQVFAQKVAQQIKYAGNDVHEMEIDLSEKNITDSQLQMMFALCHSSISAEAQISLSLRLLCGFGIDEIAAAFLSNKETINKRLLRAKDKLREQKVKIEFPGEEEAALRLQTVLTTLYLLFNEGYYSQAQNITLRRELCLEAMRLLHLLIENEATDQPSVNALMALMCFHSSRFDARINAEGETILYHDQDETLWNLELIERGEYYLQKASHGSEISKYHLEAGIAYWHTIKNDSHEKWETILQLYNQLLLMEYSMVAALNRTFALSKANGKTEAIAEAEKLKLDGSHLYHSLLGELYTDIDNTKAKAHFTKALHLAKSAADIKVITDKLFYLSK